MKENVINITFLYTTLGPRMDPRGKLIQEGSFRLASLATTKFSAFNIFASLKR